MGVSDALVALLEQEINKQVNAKITKYIEYVSRRYDVSLKLLLRDLECIDNLPTVSEPVSECQCIGMRSGNKRCKLRGQFGGYCRWHQDQKKRKEPVSTLCQPVVEHNHSIPPLFSAECPACQKTSSTPQKKLLIEM